MGVTIAFAIECYERGLLTTAETEGEVLQFGDAAQVLRLVAKTARREGFGDLLAQGTRRMADIVAQHSHRFAHHVKGLEVAGHSARALKGMAIGYATGTRGGSHQDSRPRYLRGPCGVQRRGGEGDQTQNLAGVGDSLIQCRFVMEAALGETLDSERYARLMEATVGWRPAEGELSTVGDRIWHLERLFNVREGVTREQDVLPRRVMREAIPSGPLQGKRSQEEAGCDDSRFLPAGARTRRSGGGAPSAKLGRLRPLGRIAGAARLNRGAPPAQPAGRRSAPRRDPLPVVVVGLADQLRGKIGRDLNGQKKRRPSSMTARE